MSSRRAACDQAHRLPADRLVLTRKRLGHREVVGELDDAEVVPIARDLPRDALELRE